MSENYGDVVINKEGEGNISAFGRILYKDGVQYAVKINGLFTKDNYGNYYYSVINKVKEVEEPDDISTSYKIDYILYSKDSSNSDMTYIVKNKLFSKSNKLLEVGNVLKEGTNLSIPQVCFSNIDNKAFVNYSSCSLEVFYQYLQYEISINDTWKCAIADSLDGVLFYEVINGKIKSLFATPYDLTSDFDVVRDKVYVILSSSIFDIVFELLSLNNVCFDLNYKEV